MRSSLCLPTSALCLFPSFLAVAQERPPEPAPTAAQSPEQPPKKPLQCTGGAHEGVSQAEADQVSQIVCSEMERQAPQYQGYFVVEFRGSGDERVLTLKQLGKGGRFRQRRAELESLDEARAKAPGLVRSLLWGRPVPLQENKPRSRWYGWQILSLDAVALTLVLVGAGGNAGRGQGDTTFFLGVGTYALGGPTVHLAHSNVGEATFSFVLRLGLPILGFYAGAFLGGDGGGYAGAVQGGVLGIGGAIAVDAAALARESFSQAPTAYNSSTRLSLTPAFGSKSGGLSLAGAF